MKNIIVLFLAMLVVFSCEREIGEIAEDNTELQPLTMEQVIRSDLRDNTFLTDFICHNPGG